MNAPVSEAGRFSVSKLMDAKDMQRTGGADSVLTGQNCQRKNGLGRLQTHGKMVKRGTAADNFFRPVTKAAEGVYSKK